MQTTRLMALGAIIAVAAALSQPAAAQDKVKVGVFPTASSLPYFVAIERGFFKEQNIEPETIARLKSLGAEMGLTIATYGHAGDGNLHVNVLFDGPDERPKVDAAVERMLRLTVQLGGTITGEHGVGFAKRDFLALEQSPELIDLQRRLKHFFDPSGVLNPGKIFPAPKG